MQSLLENCLKLKPPHRQFQNEEDGESSKCHRYPIHWVHDPIAGEEQNSPSVCLDVECQQVSWQRFQPTYLSVGITQIKEVFQIWLVS